MFTTRNPTLDRLSEGKCLSGVGTGDKEVERVELKFGALRGVGREGVGHCAFGLERETDGIVRGRPYAGLGHHEMAFREEPKLLNSDGGTDYKPP
jgi:hypothetical protein